MNNTGTSLVNVSLFNVVNNQRCPQCGGPMREMDRINEATTYVWFECGREDCDGQWLQSYTDFITAQTEDTISKGELQ